MYDSTGWGIFSQRDRLNTGPNVAKERTLKSEKD